MKKLSLTSLLIGLGMGFILSAVFLLFIPKQDLPADISSISDEIIMQRARELGMIDPYEGFNKEDIRISK